MKVHIHCLLSIPTSFHKPCGEWCGEKQKGLTAGSCKPLKYMVVVRLNNCSLYILKLLHKINLKFLDTNKNTNNFFWCPTGWGNAKIMGANKNLLNFSGLIKPTSLLQSSRCFRQKVSYFFTSDTWRSWFWKRWKMPERIN